MRCGFCGYDNPDGVKKCKHCKAKLNLQQTYERGSGSGFSGNVNRGGSGVTRQSTSSTVTDNMARLRNVSSVRAAKGIALVFVLVPFLFMAVVVFMIMKVNREWQREAESKDASLDDFAEEFLEHHGIGRNEYTVKKNSEDHYTLAINGWDYELINYKGALSTTNDWRSNYFTGTFDRMTKKGVEEAIYGSSFGDTELVYVYNVTGLFPIWLNFAEIDRIENGDANRTKWTDAWSHGQSWNVLVMIYLSDPDYPVSRETFDELKDELFFATDIIIKCNNKLYRYYPYEDRYVEE